MIEPTPAESLISERTSLGELAISYFGQLNLPNPLIHSRANYDPHQASIIEATAGPRVTMSQTMTNIAAGDSDAER